MKVKIQKLSKQSKDYILYTIIIIYFSGQAQRVRKFFEDLMKQNQFSHPVQSKSHYPIERITKRNFPSEVFQKLLERFDNQ